uniref:Uncharacterized protein n=1 Tax=Leersia perrieri TaxID=77586 RepID=A0A0D9VFL5_9ORYZ
MASCEVDRITDSALDLHGNVLVTTSGDLQSWAAMIRELQSWTATASCEAAWITDGSLDHLHYNGLVTTSCDLQSWAAMVRKLQSWMAAR